MNRRRLLWAALAVLMAIAVSSCSNEQKAPQAPERPYIPQVYTAAGLQEAVKSGGAVKLANDIVLPALDSDEKAALVIEKDTTINLNGKTIQVDSATSAAAASIALAKDAPAGVPVEQQYILEVKSGTLTISGNGTIDGLSSGRKAIRVGTGGADDDAKLIINGGTFKGQDACIHLNGGKVSAVINGGTFSSELEKGAKKHFTLNKEDIYKETSEITVNGGTFLNGFNPMSHSNDNDTGNDNYVADGYYTEYDKESNSYTVKQRPSGTEDYKVVWDQAGFNAITGDEKKETTGILLGADIKLDPDKTNDSKKQGFIVFRDWDNSVTLDLNGHSLTATKDGSLDFIEAINSDLTIKDSSNGNGQVGEDGAYGYRGVVAASIGTGNESASVTIEGGKFFGEIEAVFLQGKKSVGIISGGEFKTHSKFNEKYFVLNIYDADAKEGGTYFSVTGGKFINFNPADAKTDPSDSTNYVKEGYQSVKDGANDWKVVSN